MRIKNQAYWILQVSGWGTAGFIMWFYARNYRAPISDEILFSRIGIVFVTGILVSHLLRLIIKERGWMMKPVEKVIPWLGLGIVCASFVYSLLMLSAFEYFHLNTEKSRQFSFFKILTGYTIDSGMYFLPWVLIYYFYHFFRKSQKQQMDALKMESLIKELELKTIKAHINPHFIFNSLNSIRALVDENPQRARKAVTELSNILRSSMQAEKMETVPFEKELFIVKDYLALENMRFEDRLKVEYDIDKDTLNQPVPPMMLQTLVENAIKHGISKQINGGVVKIVSDFKGDFHELVVQNTGQLNGKYNAEGFGLSSTNNRLNLLYGENAKFNIRQINGSLVEAKVLIPVKTV